PALAAAEAVVEAGLRAHVEARAALVVERAQSLHRTDARVLERHVLADDVSDVGAGPHLVDVASTNEARHALIVGGAGDLPVGPEHHAVVSASPDHRVAESRPSA